MKKMLSVLASLLAWSGFACAQSYLDIDVEGLHIEDHLDYAGFVKKFGTPSKYQKTDNWDEGFDESYYIGENFFHFEGNGIFKDFTLEDNKFAVLLDSFPGGIKVGDCLSKLDSYKYGKPVYYRRCGDGTLEYRLFEKSDDPLCFVVRNDLIVRIYYVYSV